MTTLLPDYRVEIDAIDADGWYDHVANFSDANLYQMWQHGAGRGLLGSVSRIALTKGCEIVAAAEVRLRQFPVLRGGMAYVFWGPLARRNGEANPIAYAQILRALRHEYVDRRGMILRVNPRLIVEQDAESISALRDAGFSPLPHLRPKHSLIVDLRATLDDVRRNLDGKWRGHLSKAERSNLRMTSGTSLEMFDDFAAVYRRMLERKQFTPAADLQKHRHLQQVLPERLKMRIVVAWCDDQPCAGAIYSAVGDTAVYLFGATDEKGMRTSAAHLVQWQVLTALKASGVIRYDLNGIDPDRNPGTYVFKRGLAGKNAASVTFAHQFQAGDASVANYSLLAAERIRSAIRLARAGRAVAATAQ